MKTGKLFTIDVEIAEKLQNLNASQLVNGLLHEYFELRSDKNTLKEEKKAVLASIMKKKSYFPGRLKSLMSGKPSKSIDTERNGSKLENESPQGIKSLFIYLKGMLKRRWTA